MTLQRILTAAILIPLVVAAVLYAPDWLISLLVLAVTLLALHEFFDLADKAGLAGHARLTMSCVTLWMGYDSLVGRLYAVPVRGSLTNWLFVLVQLALNPMSVWVCFIAGSAILALRSSKPISDRWRALGTSSAALLYLALPMSSLIVLHHRRTLLFVLVLVWVGDTFAYFVGKNFGRHPLASALSPGKTWEGSIANLAGSLLVAIAFWKMGWFPLRDTASAALLGNIAGQIGDLMESVYKRAAGVKDSGALVPGHGGVLDRIDSLIFAAPVVWYYFEFIAQRGVGTA